MIASLVFVALGVLFSVVAAGSYVLMGVELKRMGRETPYLTVTLDVRERFRMYQRVFDEYRRLKREQGSAAAAPAVIWVAVPLAVLCYILSVVVLAR